MDSGTQSDASADSDEAVNNGVEAEEGRDVVGTFVRL